MAEPDVEIPKINPSEVETLIEKIWQNKPEEQDKRMISRLLRTLLSVVSMLEEKNVTLLRLKAMVFGKKSEKRKREEGEEGKPRDGPESGGQEVEKGEDLKAPRNEKPEGAEGEAPKRRRGHGRYPVSTYPGAKKVDCPHQELKSGSRCPNLRCECRVYPVKRPHHFIQFTGQPAILATHYELEVVRCGDCGREYEAPLPEEVSLRNV